MTIPIPLNTFETDKDLLVFDIALGLDQKEPRRAVLKSLYGHINAQGELYRFRSYGVSGVGVAT